MDRLHLPVERGGGAGDRRREPRVARIDFLEFLDLQIRELQRPEEQRHPKPLQQRAIDAAFDGLVTQGNGRGKLVMACGTGKTFTALRLAERVVADDGRVLFAAPTIALVSQARREWLTHAARPMSALVVCSDSNAGGRGRRIAAPDGLIAATARVHGLPVMTRNVSDFTPADVEVVNPWPD